MVRKYLQERRDRKRQQLWVRINPLDTELSLPDLVAVMPGAPDGICLPKVYSAKDVNKLANYLSALEAEGLEIGATKILVVATETRLLFKPHLPRGSDGSYDCYYLGGGGSVCFLGRAIICTQVQVGMMIPI